MIDRTTIDRIFSAADIVEVVGEFVQLKRKGTNYTACCPFHNEKTPSFIVSPAKGLYKCFGCGQGGNAVSFVMEHEKLTYPDALRWLAKKYSITIEERELTDKEKQANDDRESMMVLNSWADKFFQEQLDTPQGSVVGKEYFYERGFTDATIKKFGLGYSPEGGSPMVDAALKEGYQKEFLVKTGLAGERDNGTLYDKYYGRVMFPIHSLSGRVIGFGGRTMRTDKKVSKYVNSPESEIYHKSQTLYGIYFSKKAITQHDKCILVEGYTDVIQMHQAGIENVVASSGTSLTVEQIKLIKRFTNNVTVIYDGDAAGIKASMRGIDMILAEGLSVRVVPLPVEDDPDSFARKHNSTQIEEYIDHNEEDFITFKVRTLLGDKESEDPIKRAEIISDIIKSIVAIPDNVQRSVYIQECSRLMNIDREVLENEVKIKRATRTDGALGGTVARNTIRKERFVAQKSNTDTAPPPDDLFLPPDEQGGFAPATKVKKTTKEERELRNLERELAGYLVKYGARTFDFKTESKEIIELEVATTIIDELREENIEMVNEPFKTIFEDYCLFIDNDETPPENWFVNHTDPAVIRFAVDMITNEENYKPSKIWEKHDIVVHTEEDTLGHSIPKALVIYKAKVISNRLNVLQEQLVGITSMEESIEALSEISRLASIRATLYEKYNRLF